ncbi:MAG: LysE family translocator [Comamonadaceae bacterium]|nr:LysE family translocator [Comamonadaceae bacterium]
MDELRAFLFGVTLAAAVGPIALLVMRNGLNHGLRPALASALGVALADLTYAGIALGAGAVVVDEPAGAGRPVRGDVLGPAARPRHLAHRQRAACRAIDAGTSAPAAVGLLPTYLLTLANPLTILLFAGFSGQLASGPGLARCGDVRAADLPRQSAGAGDLCPVRRRAAALRRAIRGTCAPSMGRAASP